MREDVLKDLVPNIEAIALRYFRNEKLETENKRITDFDPVTLADKEIEQAFRETIGQAFPNDAIFGEEFENAEGQSGFKWTIDPIDGTRAFVIGAPSFTILIALESHQGFEAALISQPFTGERFWRFGDKAYWEKHDEPKRELKTSKVKVLSEAMLASTFPEIGTAQERRAFERVSSQVKMTRYGFDGYAHGLLALGQLDLVIEAGLMPFDYLAPWAIIEGAGGIFVNWEGKEPKGKDRIIAAATPELAEAALDLINS